VYTLCLNLCADREQAQDLLQETFVRVYRGLRTFRGGAQFATWLYRIAVNVSRDAARKQRVRERALPPAASEAGGGDMVHQVRAALTRLRADHRAVLALRYTRSLSYQEIADLLGWSLPKVKVTIHRAKQAFKTAYLGVGEEAG
jgi:RNA polymerase sigma-70 factor (ECF subfamily)